MSTEEEIRAWVRDEQDKIDAEKQSICGHGIGTLNRPKNVVVCNNCGYEFPIGGDEVAADNERFIKDQRRRRA
ncbi:hypothetical protein LCGC14_2423680 [marine sediment metagenome]|uniref:Uncharacterized protein n=1 Tax=marine sediment metagenome TaxID=412755 RepID=A0A0F9CB29_9ZZZZ